MTGNELNPVDKFPELFSDNEYQVALSEFFNTPLTDDEKIIVTREIFGVPKLWAQFSKETLHQTRKRRKSLSKRLRDLAKEFKLDPEAKYIRIITGHEVTTSLIPGSRPAYEFFNDLAEMLDEKEKSEFYESRVSFEEIAKNKRDQKSFCKRAVVGILDSINQKTTFPNAAAAVILNKLLRPNLRDRITDDDVYQIRKSNNKKI